MTSACWTSHSATVLPRTARSFIAWALKLRLRGYRFKAAGLAVQFRSFGPLVKVKNPKALAIKREAEEDWGRGGLIALH